ncbi:hypothetical protein P0136_03330 [Lentisphaerota bacterium ZTH]|nr:hypothetical protein JYG24_05540 [Lentisphaerota bacterium]WET07033.1 hypothetical protein P0136_03330 [Lentisphaerota bacterium ZTH]
MDIVFSTIVNDSTIRELIRENRKLYDYVHHYLNRPLPYLQQYYPDLLSTLNALLAPGIMAYHCYINGIDIFFPRGWLYWKLRHVNKKTESKMRALFSSIEAVLPRCCGDLDHYEELREKFSVLLKEHVDSFRKRHNLNNHSFWNLCQIFYGQMPEGACYLPSTEGLENFYLRGFSSTNYDELRRRIFQIASNFREEWPQVNTIMKHDGQIVDDEGFYPENLINDKMEDLGHGFHYQLSKDLLTHNMKVEEWELLTYYNSQTRNFQYMPLREASALSHLMVYKRMAVLMSDPDMREDKAQLNVDMKASFKFFVRQVMFLIGVYGFEGKPTSNAVMLLEEMNKRKSQFWNMRLTNRGHCFEFWNPGSSEDLSIVNAENSF